MESKNDNWEKIVLVIMVMISIYIGTAALYLITK